MQGYVDLAFQFVGSNLSIELDAFCYDNGSKKQQNCGAKSWSRKSEMLKSQRRNA